MIKFAFAAILVFCISIAVGFVNYFPVSIILSQVSMPSFLKLNYVDGTLLKGKALGQVSISGVSINAGLEWISCFDGVSPRWCIQLDGGELQASLRLSPKDDNQLYLDQGDIEFNLGNTLQLPLAIQPTLNLFAQLDHIELDLNGCSVGLVRNVSISGSASEISFGDMQLGNGKIEIQGNGHETLTGTFKGDIAEGGILIKDKGHYVASITAAADISADLALISGATIEPDGRYKWATLNSVACKNPGDS